MKILNQKRDGNKVVVEVEEAYSAFETAIQNALLKASKDIRLPGFRQGKAPKEMVERALDHQAIEYHAAQDLISDLYPQIIDQAKLQPVDYPNVEIIQHQKGKDFIFKLTVEVFPEVKLGKYKGLKVTKKSALVTEEELIKILGNLQERFAVTDAEGKKELLPLDDEFAKKVSRHGTLAELKTEITEAFQKDKSAEAEADLKNQLVGAVSAEAKFDLPAAIAEREIDEMISELRSSLAQSGLTLEDYLKGTKKEEKALREEMKKAAEIRARGKVVLKTIAEVEKITVTPEDIKAELKLMTENSSQSPEELEKNMGQGGRDFLTEYLLRKKALDFLIHHATIKEEGDK